MDMWQQ
jgi:DNA repair exonuclease SbcCD ATPase subunit